jgi:ATP-dependent DNA ligase
LHILSKIKIPKKVFEQERALDAYSVLINSKYQNIETPVENIIDSIQSEIGKPVVDSALLSILSKSKLKNWEFNRGKEINYFSLDNSTQEVSLVNDQTGDVQTVNQGFYTLNSKEDKFLKNLFIDFRIKNFRSQLTVDYFYSVIQTIFSLTGPSSHAKKSECLIELFSFDLSLEEKKFILEIITRDLKFGASLNSFHKVFCKLAEENCFSQKEMVEYERIFGNTLNDSLQLGFFVDPMLSNNAVSIQDLEKKLLSKKAKEVLVEEKFDGERIQIHLSRETLYHEFSVKLFSRNGEQSTQKYSFMLEDLEQAFFNSRVCSAIFDGEIIPFDFENNEIQSFHHIQKMKTKNQEGSLIPCKIVVFDIMSLNGEEMVKKNLQQRKNVLIDIFEEIESEKIELISHQKITFSENSDQKDDLFSPTMSKIYNQSKFNNNEGLIIKSKFIFRQETGYVIN